MKADKIKKANDRQWEEVKEYNRKVEAHNEDLRELVAQCQDNVNYLRTILAAMSEGAANMTEVGYLDVLLKVVSSINREMVYIFDLRNKMWDRKQFVHQIFTPESYHPETEDEVEDRQELPCREHPQMLYFDLLLRHIITLITRAGRFKSCIFGCRTSRSRKTSSTRPFGPAQRRRRRAGAGAGRSRQRSSQAR